MVKDKYKIVGVMSGTSLDGVDLVYAHFTKETIWEFEIIAAETLPYSKTWVAKLQHLVAYSKEELKTLDEAYTVYLAECIQGFLDAHNITEVDAICSHGHTALHDPDNGLTYQIGNLPKLANLLKQTVVCDFRVDDVALGGQGAPLVPAGDALLFTDYAYCLNLGGFANVSTELYGKRIAFDVCPANIVLNHYVKPLGMDYDAGGVLASSGEVHQELLDALNGLSFYGTAYPKSLGLEWVKVHVFPLIDSYHLKTEVILRTFTEHIAIQIANVVPDATDATMLITGGGAYNTFLLERIKALTRCTIAVPNSEIIEFKEALIFGFLGVLKLRGEVNCLMSVTGAEKNHSSGYIYYG